MLGAYETQEYEVPVAGRTVRLLGPKYPHALSNNTAYVRQRRGMDAGYVPRWALPWPSAIMLAEHVIRRISPEVEAPRGPMLEVGAGLGLVGIALALAGQRVVMTDYDEDALLFIRENARLNGVTLEDVQRLDWREPPPEKFAAILAADCIYERRYHTPLLALLAACLNPGGAAFFSDPNRSLAEDFICNAQTAGFVVEATPAQARAIPNFDAKDGRIFNGKVLRIFRE